MAVTVLHGASSVWGASWGPKKKLTIPNNYEDSVLSEVQAEADGKTDSLDIIEQDGV